MRALNYYYRVENGLKRVVIIFTLASNVLLIALVGSCSRQTTEEDQVNVKITLPKDYSSLASQGPTIKTSGARLKEVSNYERLDYGSNSSLTLTEKTSYGNSTTLAGHAVVGLNRTGEKELILFICGQPSVSVEYNTNTDYSISKSGGPSIIILRCSASAHK